MTVDKVRKMFSEQKLINEINRLKVLLYKGRRKKAFWRTNISFQINRIQDILNELHSQLYEDIKEKEGTPREY